MSSVHSYSARGKFLADYQDKHKPGVNRAAVKTCLAIAPELSITLCTIWACLTSLIFFASQLENRTILRIVLHGLGSPLWGEEQHIAHEISPSLTSFLFQLRSTLRSAFAVCFVTIPTHLFQVLSFLFTILVNVCIVNANNTVRKLQLY